MPAELSLCAPCLIPRDLGQKRTDRSPPLSQLASRRTSLTNINPLQSSLSASTVSSNIWHRFLRRVYRAIGMCHRRSAPPSPAENETRSSLHVLLFNGYIKDSVFTQVHASAISRAPSVEIASRGAATRRPPVPSDPA